MELVKFMYEETEIDFQPTRKNNVMVNATQMAKLFGKTVEHFTRLDNTKLFIEECLKNPNMGFLAIENKDGLINSKQKSGTWMHRVLALKFAAWLNPEFELWVYITIDRVLNHFFRDQQDALLKKISLKHEKEEKKKQLLEKYPEIADYFQLEEKVKESHNTRMASMRQQFRQLELDFDQEMNETD